VASGKSTLAHHLEATLEPQLTVDTVSTDGFLFPTDYLREQIKLALSEATSQQSDFSLMVIDLDHFSQVNHTHGYHEGDQVLQAVTQLLLLNLRDDDLLCRLAGDRFVAVLHNMSVEQAEGLAADIRLAIAHFAYRTKETGTRLHLSASTAVTKSDTNSHPDGMIKTLHEKLQHNKQGRTEA